MAERFKYQLLPPKVVAVECEQVGYPHTDADGDTQYDNTHFDTEAAATDCLLRNLRASIRLTASSIEEQRKRLADDEAHLVELALARDQVERWDVLQRDTGGDHA